jgi:hypothetical protein
LSLRPFPAAAMPLTGGAATSTGRPWIPVPPCGPPVQRRSYPGRDTDLRRSSTIDESRRGLETSPRAEYDVGGVPMFFVKRLGRFSLAGAVGVFWAWGIGRRVVAVG